MNFDENISFSNMLNSEYPYEESTTPPPPNIYFSQDNGGDESGDVTVLSSQVFSSQKFTDRRPRTKNFTKEEDEMLISAWHNISSDPITGVDQTIGTYCGRVHKYFMKYKNFESDRSEGSLMHRWSVIQLAVNKFHGFYTQVGAPSGYSEDDKIRNAKAMYKDNYKSNFSLEHCWKVLKNLPKWNATFATKKPKNSRNDSPTAASPGTPECVVLGDTELKRPIGRKAAKKNEKKRKRSENEQDDGGAAILEQIRADQLESKKQRNEHLKEMVQLAKERAEREKEKDERAKKKEANKQDEADAKIMAVDTSDMGALEIEYFNARKKEIIERIRNRSSAT
ncbi:hypothetical protein POM88_016186 [Heracleum sosnowskyi]|uniref:No apical meristem-associated C-terminal domain-containing protein n=1 Tax=Heracleum sosnowskyi TaxID=360622 RepID=A0AAD8MY80_9APIA|nr:hypothetical protein POM88_016186 [Heracleum sosnowskyi]